MLLKKVTIHKYKSFLTEQSYEVERSITRVVGKNESGKTALLESLAKSNYFEDSVEFKFDKDLDYPRSELTRVRSENPAVLTCEYELSDDIIKSIEGDFAEGIVARKTFSVTSYYDNSKTISGISTDFEVFKEWLISIFDIEDQGNDLIQAACSYSDLEKSVYENISISGMKEVKAELDKIKRDSNGWTNTLTGYIYKKYISPDIPKLWYFSDYFSLPCRINLNEFS